MRKERARDAIANRFDRKFEKITENSAVFAEKVRNENNGNRNCGKKAS